MPVNTKFKCGWLPKIDKAISGNVDNEAEKLKKRMDPFKKRRDVEYAILKIINHFSCAVAGFRLR